MAKLTKKIENIKNEVKVEVIKETVKEVIPPKKETKLNNTWSYKCPKCGNKNNIVGQRCGIDNEIMQYIKD